jgi:hypothetical protein
MSEPTPDHVPCRHCGVLISWDEVCWTHDDTGFATCGTVITGTEKIKSPSGSMTLYVDPRVTTEGPHAGKNAEPVGPWS